MASHGEYNHIEIPADDPARANRFYSGVFGWDLGTMEGMPDYWLYRSGPGDLGGAIGIRGHNTGKAIRNYITVDSIDGSLPKVESLGGKVIEGKGEVQGYGWFAVVEDSEGNEIGLFEELPR